MRKIKATELKDYIGKKVKVVYAVRETANTGELVYVYGADITDDVTLKNYDQNEKTVTFVRANGEVETKSPVLVLTEED